MQKTKSDNKIKEMMAEAMKDINSIVDVNTIIGKPFTSAEGKTIIPVSKVTVGFMTGGGEYGEVKSFKQDSSMPFAGGSGAVVSLKPAGFLVDDGSDIRLINVSNDVFERMFETAEEFVKGMKNED